MHLGTYNFYFVFVFKNNLKVLLQTFSRVLNFKRNIWNLITDLLQKRILYTAESKIRELEHGLLAFMCRTPYM